MEQAFLLKHVGYEYNQQSPFCVYAPTTRLFSRRRGNSTASLRPLSCISIELDPTKGLGSGFRTCQCMLLFPRTSRTRRSRFRCWVGYTMTIDEQHKRCKACSAMDE